MRKFGRTTVQYLSNDLFSTLNTQKVESQKIHYFNYLNKVIIDNSMI